MRRALLALLVAPVALRAQAATPPAPCLGAPEHHRFDFWIGEWDVTTQNGTPTGTSSIQLIAGGCALLENWTGARGGTGKSINSYNATAKSWQQYWVGSGGDLTFYREATWNGEKSVSFMAIPPSAGGASKPVARLTFTAQPDGTVRQLGEQSTDEGKTFVTTYDFIYHRRK